MARFGGRPFIACGPGTKMQAKDWGPENWRALLASLTAKLPNHGLILVGAKEDAAVSEYSCAQWTGPVANLCGLLTPRETAAVLKPAELFLGPDSGPMHLAAAYGVPCAIVYASRSRRGHWFPTGTGHEVVYHTPVSYTHLDVYKRQAQQAEGVLAGDGKGGGFNARLFAVLVVVHLGAETLLLSPPQIHAQQHLGPVLRFRATSAGLDGYDCVQPIVFTGEKSFCFQLG